jgi:hypothetical protein
MREQKRLAPAQISAQSVHRLFAETPSSIMAKQTRVYFIQEGERGPIKIGLAMEPLKRLATLQTGHPRPLRLLRAVAGTARHERDVHMMFFKEHLRGEWFKPSKRLISYIENAEDFAMPAPRPAKRKRKLRVV